MRLEVDFAKVDEPIPGGSYAFEVSGANLGEVKKVDSPIFGSKTVIWDLMIVEPGPNLGRKLRFNSNLSDKATTTLPDGTKVPDEDAARKSNYYLREFLKTIGCVWDEKGFDLEAAIHCKGIAKVSIGTYNGRPVNQVDEILPFQAA
jgi:hypothetical protein